MAEQASEILHLALRCDTQAPRRAREAIDDIRGIGPVREDARLVTTELVSNAVRHSGCGPDDMLRLSARLSRDRLEVSVHDPGHSDRTARLRPQNDPLLGGLGLLLVEQIARRWGADRPDGQLVWAELDIAQPAGTTAAQATATPNRAPSAIRGLGGL
jgi:hypothetical protein